MFAAAFVFGILTAMPSVSSAQTAATTFPVNEAGIAAYVKLDSISQTNFDRARQSLFDSVESFGDTYMIGVKEYSIDGIDGGPYNKVNLHMYLGADGWLVVYLLKTEEPSRIVNWRADAATGKLVPLSDTLLKFAIEDATSKIGASALTSAAYYDFAQPEATKMTMIREIIEKGGQESSDEFTVLVPGTLQQASWATKCFDCAINSWDAAATLYVDNNYAAGEVSTSFDYGDYDNAMLGGNKSHAIRLDRRSGSDDYVGAVTLLLYSPN